MPGRHRLHADGGARGNPGPAGIGVVLTGDQGEVLEQVSKGIGWATNNVAEYRALIEGLELARSLGVDEIEVYMDSELVVHQMEGKYRVKSAGLKPFYAEARKLAAGFRKIEFKAVPREQNAHADLLVNEAIDDWILLNQDFTPPESPTQTEMF